MQNKHYTKRHVSRADKKFNNLFYTIFCFIYIAIPFYILCKYNFLISDDDQALMWYSSKEFSHFRFHEPMFFGQSYGTMMEGLLAVPLIWLNVPYYIVLPFISFLLTMIPCLIISLYCYKKSFVLAAMIVLLAPLSVDASYFMISFLPRSFVPGIAIATLGCFLLWVRRKNIVSCIIGGILLSIGYICSANSLVIIIIAFAGLSLLILNEALTSPHPAYTFYKISIDSKALFDGIKYVFITVGGSLAGLSYLLFAKKFYVDRPDYNLHSSYTDFSLQRIADNYKSFGVLYSEVTPLVKTGWALLGLFVAFIIFGIIKKRYAFSVLSAVTIVLFFLIMGVNKLYDYRDSILFSQTRMLLFVPTSIGLLCLFYVMLSPKQKHNPSKINTFALLLAAVIMCTFKIYIFIHDYDDYFKYDVISPVSNRSIYLAADELKSICESEDITLIVVNDDSGASRCLAYAVGAILNDDADTLLTHYERRTWIYQDAQTRVEDKFLFVRTRLDNIHVSTINEIVYPQGESVIDWIAETLGSHRKSK